MKRLILLCALALAGCGKTAATDSPLQAAARHTCMDTIEARAINRNSVAYIADGTPVATNSKGQEFPEACAEAELDHASEELNRLHSIEASSQKRSLEK